MRYTRMHGAGNSFVLIENRNGELQGINPGKLALRLCGKNAFNADGLIVVVPAKNDEDFGMLFYNADGSLGEMCGNGARCLARYGIEHGLAENPDCIRIAATAGMVTGRRITEDQYEVRLNDPSVIDLHRQIIIHGKRYDCSYVELGNPGIPHAVVETTAEEMKDLSGLREEGRALRHCKDFPKGANVTFAQIMRDGTVKAITFERGVEDFTLACGTGCGATAVALLLRRRISENPVKIVMPGGELSVTVGISENKVHDILLQGPTAVLEEGEFEPNS